MLDRREYLTLLGLRPLFTLTCRVGTIVTKSVSSSYKFYRTCHWVAKPMCIQDVSVNIVDTESKGSRPTQASISGNLDIETKRESFLDQVIGHRGFVVWSCPSPGCVGHVARGQLSRFDPHQVIVLVSSPRTK